jgi:hypothetical protein
MDAAAGVTQDEARTRDGRTLYVERQGTGWPTVVFEAGMGSSRSAWGAVVPAVAERTTTVVYDRSGLGRSPATRQPRVLSRLVDDLTDVLDHLDAPPDSDADDTALRSRATAAPQGVHVNAVESGHMAPSPNRG